MMKLKHTRCSMLLLLTVLAFELACVTKISAQCVAASCAAQSAKDDDTRFDLHVMVQGDARVMGRDRDDWIFGGGAKVFLGNVVGDTAIGGMLGFRALGLRERSTPGYETYRWMSDEALMAYDFAAAAETRWGTPNASDVFGWIAGGHVGAAFVPASKVRFVTRSTISTERPPYSAGSAACSDGICRLDRSYSFAISVGARIGMRWRVHPDRDVTFQVGIDGRAPVRGNTDIDLVLLVGLASY